MDIGGHGSRLELDDPNPMPIMYGDPAMHDDNDSAVEGDQSRDLSDFHEVRIRVGGDTCNWPPKLDMMSCMCSEL